MRKTKIKRIVTAVLASALMVSTAALFAGCGSTDTGTSGGGSTAESSLSGKLTLNGSTSMATVCQALGEVFHEQNPGVTVEKSGTGSGDASKAVLAGTALIGDLSRELKDSENPDQFEVVQIATDGIAIAVHKDNPVSDLTQEQIAKIFTGEITNWSEVGGQDQAITVLGREASSGTRDGFEAIFGVEGEAKYAAELTSTGEVLNRVASDPAAVGYISLASVSPSIKAVKVDGVEATDENIVNGTYKVSRPFNIAVKKDMKNEVAKDFINYVMSEEGQKIVSDNGYIPVDGAKPYSGKEVSGKVVVGGSSSVSPVMEKLIEGYKAVNSKANVELQTTDSTTGMTSTIDGSYDIGMASRDLKDDEAAKLQNTVIATDGIAVIVNKNNTTDELSADQVKSIYTGDATTWDEVVK